jgi:serine/threonine protein kinase
MTDPKIGSEIGSYRITEAIGHGGMGTVYRAKHPHIGKEVAIKFLQGDFAQDAETLRRFELEAKVVNDIKHPNIVDILDFGRTPANEFYMIMEILEGRSLKTLIEASDAPLPTERICHIALQVCSGLNSAHQKDIVHRDLKSDNIFLIQHQGKEDFVKIFDFGLVKFVGEKQIDPITSPGMTVGTPLYMSPEQAFGRDVDHQTDIYALGIVLYRMTTKEYPFNDKNPFVVASQQVSTPITPPSKLNPAINPNLEKVILRCLEKRKDRRYSSMLYVAQDLATVSGLELSHYFYGMPTPTKTAPTSQLVLYTSIAASVMVLMGSGYLLGTLLREEPADAPAREEVTINVIQMTPATTQATKPNAKTNKNDDGPNPAKKPKPPPPPPPKKKQWLKGLFGNK